MGTFDRVSVHERLNTTALLCLVGCERHNRFDLCVQSERSERQRDLTNVMMVSYNVDKEKLVGG